MLTVTSVKEMRNLSQRMRAEKRIGFVPTMGFLHEGHLSLVRMARMMSDLTVVSIFVNPIQFGPKEDYLRYPRDIERDSTLLERGGADILFLPAEREMYPEGYATYVQVRGLEDLLCGKTRKGHFLGVATVVLKLFNIVRPHIAVFGEKDYQQLKVIERMVRDLHLDVEIVPHPIVREPDGLAMSSRNTYLSEEERRRAPSIFRSLEVARALFLDGERRARAIKEKVEAFLKDADVQVEYVSVCHPDTLQELDRIEGSAVVLVACWIGRTRLIDNIFLREDGSPCGE